MEVQAHAGLAQVSGGAPPRATPPPPPPSPLHPYFSSSSLCPLDARPMSGRYPLSCVGPSPSFSLSLALSVTATYTRARVYMHTHLHTHTHPRARTHTVHNHRRRHHGPFANAVEGEGSTLSDLLGVCVRRAREPKSRSLVLYAAEPPRGSTRVRAHTHSVVRPTDTPAATQTACRFRLLFLATSSGPPHAAHWCHPRPILRRFCDLANFPYCRPRPMRRSTRSVTTSRPAAACAS